MSQRTSEVDSLYHALASSTAAFDALLDYWRLLHQEETEKLNSLAVSALLRPDLLCHAQVQVGRVSMIKDLIDLAEKYRSV